MKSANGAYTICLMHWNAVKVLEQWQEYYFKYFGFTACDVRETASVALSALESAAVRCPLVVPNKGCVRGGRCITTAFPLEYVTARLDIGGIYVPARNRVYLITLSSKIET